MLLLFVVSHRKGGEGVKRERKNKREKIKIIVQKMRSLLLFVVALPQIILCDTTSSSNDNEKYSQHPQMPQSSLYCNDLNPQMHLDFNMVN